MPQQLITCLFCFLHFDLKKIMLPETNMAEFKQAKIIYVGYNYEPPPISTYV